MATIAPKALRGPGTVGVTVPATSAQAGSLYVFTALMNAADIQDATLAIPFRLFLDARLVWDNTLNCGVRDRNGTFQAPNFSYSCPEDPPTNFRVEADLPRQVNIGMDVTLASRTQLAG